MTEVAKGGTHERVRVHISGSHVVCCFFGHCKWPLGYLPHLALRNSGKLVLCQKSEPKQREKVIGIIAVFCQPPANMILPGAFVFLEKMVKFKGNFT